MFELRWTTVITVCILVGVVSPVPGGRHKRSRIYLCQMIQTMTNRWCVEYLDYGCYCGHGNSGGEPVDEVDRCCQSHDVCFDQTTCYNSWRYTFNWYKYQCNGTTCHCTDLNDDCQMSRCQCDLELSLCLGRQTYNVINYDYNQTLCTAA